MTYAIRRLSLLPIIASTNTSYQQYNKPYKIHEIPAPQPSNLGPHELLLKVGVASLCHTDSMVQKGIMGPASLLPQTASHEGAGTVIATGSKVSDSKLKKGDRVMVGVPKGRCTACLSCKGKEDERQYCPRLEGHVGVTTDGTFAEYVVCDARDSVVVPDGVSLTQAAPLACAGCTIWRGIVQTGHKGDGAWIAITGAGGGLGHLGVQFAKRAFGLRVIAVDARDEGLALAKEAGADVVLDARVGKEELVKRVHDIVRKSPDEFEEDLGVEVAINVSEAESAAAISCAVTRMHGKVVQIAQVSFNPKNWNLRCWMLIYWCSLTISLFRSQSLSSVTYISKARSSALNAKLLICFRPLQITKLRFARTLSKVCMRCLSFRSWRTVGR